jgi:hypothetical protein
VGVSCDSKNLIAYEMEPDKSGPWLVKKVGVDCFLYVGAKFFPSIALRKNVLAETFGDESTVFFLVYTEDDLHAENSCR